MLLKIKWLWTNIPAPNDAALRVSRRTHLTGYLVMCNYIHTKVCRPQPTTIISRGTGQT